MLRWIPVLFGQKRTPVAETQDRKGTPFEHFPRVLSTNQRAGFYALDQSEASISVRFWASVESEAIQCTANLPLECHSDQSSANEINFISKYATGLPSYQVNATLTNEKPMESISGQFMPFDCHSANSLPLCHWSATGSFFNATAVHWIHGTLSL